LHKIRLPHWAHERGRSLNALDALAPRRTVLVVVDMQRAFIAEGEVFGNAHARDVIDPVNRLVAAARGAAVPVVWTRQTFVGAGAAAAPPWQYDPSDAFVRRATAALTAGAPSHAIHPAMAVGADDLVIDKTRYGAFSCPRGELPAALGRLDAEMLVICGTLTNCCCDSTAREANMAGYKVIVAADACAAVTDAEHNAALLNLRIMFADVKRARQIEGMFARLPRAPGLNPPGLGALAEA
jgi:nicotinamidase-related amidase